MLQGMVALWHVSFRAASELANALPAMRADVVLQAQDLVERLTDPEKGKDQPHPVRHAVDQCLALNSTLQNQVITPTS